MFLLPAGTRRAASSTAYAFRGTTFEGCTVDNDTIETLRERNADLQNKIHMLEHELLVEREATLYVRIELRSSRGS